MDLYELIKNLYGVEELKGYSDEDIDFLKEIFGGLPSVLEEYYRKAGRTEELMDLQDEWILPEHYKKWDWLKEEKDFYILMNENQGVFQIGIRKEDMTEPNPPVYIDTENLSGEGWQLYCPTLSEFLLCETAYQAVFTFGNSLEEFYALTKDELNIVETKLQKYPFEIRNDMEDYPFNISFYYNACDNLYVVMNGREDDVEVLYGAVSEESYNKLDEAVGEIGEPI